MESEKKYNLLSEPWIVVIDDTGITRKLSMIDVFREAHRYRALAGDLPTQDIAIIRVLLAVLYGVFTQYDAKGDPLSEVKGDRPFRRERDAFNHWQALWNKGTFPCEVIERYLKDYEERFYLFHPETPFFQVAGIKTADGQVNSVTQIIADVPSRIERRFFSNRLGNQIRVLEYDEAARWLINLHAWDYAGKKNAVVGGSPNGGGTGWLGKLGVVYLTGDNIFETLMLNLSFVDANGLIELGSPSWEQSAKMTEKQELRPRGYVDLLTWQSRRVLLFEESGAVTGVLASYGDVFDKENMFMEQMSGWHRSSEKSEKDKFIPNTLNKDRSMWRDLNALLPLSVSNSDDIRVPGIVRWRGFLKEKNAIDVESVNISAIGAEYGAMMGVVNELITDHISFNVNLLTDLGQVWIPQILDVLEKTDNCINLLARLARELAKSAGADDKDKKLLDAVSGAARTDTYFTFDVHFRNWLELIDPENDDRYEVCNRWKEAMRTKILSLGKEMVDGADSRAFVGRDKKTNALTAYLTFKGSVYKVVPMEREKGDHNG